MFRVVVSPCTGAFTATFWIISLIKYVDSFVFVDDIIGIHTFNAFEFELLSIEWFIIISPIVLLSL